MAFNSISRKCSLSTDIAEALQSAIFAGQFKPGAKLPGQRDLALQFGASLATVREAISVLAASGVIETRQGHGTIVRSSTEGKTNYHGWLGLAVTEEERDDFLEARLLLESHIIAKMVREWRPEDLKELETALREMRRAIKNPEKYLEKDLQFHWKLAEIAGNKVLLKMLEAIYVPMGKQIAKTMAGYMKEQGNLMASYERHAALFEHIRNRDAERALESITGMINPRRRRD